MAVTPARLPYHRPRRASRCAGNAVMAVGDVAEEIVRVALEERVTLIVMGIHGKKGWRRLLLEHVTEKVVQRSPVPVITLWSPRGSLRPLTGVERPW